MTTLPTFHRPNAYPDFPGHLQTLPENEAPPSYPASQEARLDIPQLIEKRLARLNASQNVLKRWSIELVCWATSAICMGLIIGILAYLKDGGLSKWPIGLTLITVLSKVATAALIIPTSEAIGQLKWSWFNGASKEMFDFEIFDKASRGAWGSAMLLLRTRGRSLAALGAVLTLFMLAADTFFQQVTNLPERWTLQGRGQISQVIHYDPQFGIEFRGGAELVQQDPNMVAVTEMFFYDNGTQLSPVGDSDGNRPEIPLSCPTSVCTWPLYQTLGVCSECVDVSQLLSYACLSSKVDWTADTTGYSTENTYPNGTMCGYFINATSTQPVFMSGYNIDSNMSYAGETLLMRALPLYTNPLRTALFGGSINYKHIRNPITDFIIASAKDGFESVHQNERPTAKECVIYWCVKTVNSTYQSGAYKEEIISNFTNNTSGPSPWLTYTETVDGVFGTEMFYTQNVTIDSSEEGSQDYGVSNETQMYTIKIFDDILPSFTTTVNESTDSIMRFKFVANKNPNWRKMEFNPWLGPNNITSHIERLATALTNAIRSTGSGQDVFGTASAKQVFVHVEWAWLAFPLALLVLSGIFIVATILKTSKEKNDVGVWKTSTMPTLIYSLPKDLQQSLTSDGPAWTAAGRAGAKKTRIKLLPNNKGWRVSGYSSAPTTPVMRRQAPPGWI